MTELVAYQNYVKALKTCDILANGSLVVPPRRSLVSPVALATGTLRLSYFIAPADATYTQVSIYDSGTLATLVTLSRIGLFSVDPATKDITLIAAITNDVTLYSAGAKQTRTFTTGAAVVTKNNRYAVGQLIVNTGTAPTVIGLTSTVNTSLAWDEDQRISASVTGQANLPAIAGTIAAASILSGSMMPGAVLVP